MMHCIDAHAHIFSTVRGRIKSGSTSDGGYGTLRIGSETIRIMPPLNERTRHTAEMLIAGMDDVDVEKAVLLQGPIFGDMNDCVIDACRRYPERLAAMAYFDPWADGAQEALQALLSRPFAGIKLECSEETGLYGIHDDAGLDDSGLQWFWEELNIGERVLTLDLGRLDSLPGSTEAVRHIAKAYPRIKIVISHLGHPFLGIENSDESFRLWREQIDLGQFSNVWFDTASLPAYFSDELYPFPRARQLFFLAIDRIGPSKIMWGTDIPSQLHRWTYRQLVQLGLIYTETVSGTVRDQVMYQNANDVYFSCLN